MSKKHFQKYYDQVCDQYHTFIEQLKVFDEECKKGIVPPEIINNVKATIAPLKNNWETLNYVMYLLNKPNKKSKEKRYENQNKNLLKNCKTKEAVIDENQSCLEKVKEVTKV